MSLASIKKPDDTLVVSGETLIGSIRHTPTQRSETDSDNNWGVQILTIEILTESNKHLPAIKNILYY